MLQWYYAAYPQTIKIGIFRELVLFIFKGYVCIMRSIVPYITDYQKIFLRNIMTIVNTVDAVIIIKQTYLRKTQDEEAYTLK